MVDSNYRELKSSARQNWKISRTEIGNETAEPRPPEGAQRARAQMNCQTTTGPGLTHRWWTDRRVRISISDQFRGGGGGRTRRTRLNYAMDSRRRSSSTSATRETLREARQKKKEDVWRSVKRIPGGRAKSFFREDVALMYPYPKATEGIDPDGVIAKCNWGVPRHWGSSSSLHLMDGSRSIKGAYSGIFKKSKC